MSQLQLASRRTRVLAEVLTHVDARTPLVLLKAPPGSGKTHVIVRGAVLAFHNGQRVAIATQTNAQANDLCRRMAIEFPAVRVHRFASASLDATDLGASVAWISAKSDLPAGPCVVVAVTAKWATSGIDEAFDVMFVDEAWQMTWADFVVMGTHAAGRFVLVGDPGQIAPVVSIDPSRWQTSRRPPHLPAPVVIARDRGLPAHWLELPVTTRLPADSTDLVRTFYDFDFDAWAAPGDRALRLEGRTRHAAPKGVDAVIDRLTTGSIAMLSIATPASGPPPEEDLEVAQRAADIARRLLERGARTVMGTHERVLTAEDIGISATHRVMNARIEEALGELSRSIRVDTPERWQGLERKVMIAVHPLSGVATPTAFDLATGRLCVMASRHEVGLVLVGRDHIEQTLAEHVPVADQAVGQADEAGRGHAQHLAVMEWLRHRDRVAAA